MGIAWEGARSEQHLGDSGSRSVEMIAALNHQVLSETYRDDELWATLVLSIPLD
jgi:hypothetical protein